MESFGNSFSSAQLLCFLESFVPFEFTVLPSLKRTEGAFQKVGAEAPKNDIVVD